MESLRCCLWGPVIGKVILAGDFLNVFAEKLKTKNSENLQELWTDIATNTAIEMPATRSGKRRDAEVDEPSGEPTKRLKRRVDLYV